MYKYHLRPGYESTKLLIEIFNGAENENFLSDFMNTISELLPKIDNVNDLWMNDEVVIEVDSETGKFIISKDVWDLAFIMADNNQECILQINSILESAQNFEKVEVDFDNYKL